MTGCGPDQGVLNAGRSVSPIQTAQEHKSALEQDLEAMRTAKFTFVYALRRRDGKSIDTADIAVIKQLTADANRRVKTDDDRAVLIGSNFEIPKENLVVLFDKFAVDDYSLPIPADANMHRHRSSHHFPAKILSDRLMP